MEFLKQLPFNVKIFTAVGLSYVLILIVAFVIYLDLQRIDQDKREELKNLNELFTALSKESAESPTLAQLKKLQANYQNTTDDLTGTKWMVVAGIPGAILLGIILVAITVGGVHKLINQTLRTVAKKLQGATGQVSAISSEVSQACQVLAEGASEQAASIEETSASLEELASMAKQNFDNVRQAKARANDARTIAEAGAQEMHQMSSVMDSMQSAGQELDRSMLEIKNSGDAISKIIKTIDEIAFQTNILALNAAVEAARAGEAGMGFAVVADEVRNLAKRSADAARETSQLIENSISKSDQGVHMSQRVSGSLKQIIDSSRLVDKRLQEIVAQAREVDTFMNQISESSSQQTQGVEQITHAVHQMDKVTQQSAASSEESAAAAQDLHGQSKVLKESVQELLHLIGADKEIATRGSSSSAFTQTAPLATVPSSAAGKSSKGFHQVQLQTSRVPEVTSRASRAARSAPSLPASRAPKTAASKSIPMDDFKDF
jgi:methyl-accepting chemotaxis protein